MARPNGYTNGHTDATTKSTYNREDIAIIGTSCRVAGADSPYELWSILASSKDVQKQITRFNGDGYYSGGKKGRKGLSSVKHAYLMDGDVSKFDNGFFAIGGHEAAAMDPQQRVLLEVAYEAFENAGITLESLRGSDTAVYASTTSPDYLVSALRDLSSVPKYTSTGSSNPGILANRISYFFDLHGPSLVVDTACSSTMVSLHYACQSLKSGESKMAVVCGVNLILNPDMFVHMSQLGFLSPSGRCRTFDAKGDGYARGEGALALILKPLGQALDDGDPIRAVIKATRINHNGRTQGISLPSKEEQQRNLEGLYGSTGIDPASIQYFEAHGTGTAAGDPIELNAINAVFNQPSDQSRRQHKLVVGSVKSNIGHLESCAALAGLVKTVECLERAQIPPQMHFETPNPKIDFSNVEIPTSVIPWPSVQAHQKRRAAINSFGFGGVNAHTVLEQAPQVVEADFEEIDRLKLFKISAGNDTSLLQMAASLADYVDSVRPNLVDLSHTLLSRRSTLKRSLFISASSSEELVEKLRAVEANAKPLSLASDDVSGNRCFIFTGQGAQWPTMGSNLLRNSPLFLSIVRECDRVLQSLPDAPSWSALEEFSKPKETSRVNISSLSQPLCTILQLGLVEIWKSWGVTPQAVVGHSSGEVAAAYAAGILSLRDAVIVAFYRGLYLGSDGSSKEKPKGGMCAVGLSESSAKELLRGYEGRVTIAAVNSPSSCTLSGDIDAVEEVAERCKRDGTFCRLLRVDMAYHSHHMLPLSGKYEEAMTNAGVTPKTSSGEVKMYSSVYGRLLSPQECVPSYWKRNMVSPVLFTAAIRAMKADQEALSALLELGPHPALKGPVEDTLADLGVSGTPYFSSLSRGKPDLEALHESAGRMITSGFPLNTVRINAVEFFSPDSESPFGISYHIGRVLKNLPTYRWDHSASHWNESRISENIRHRQFPRHEVLGARMAEDTPLRMGWRNLLSLKELAWLDTLKEKGEETIPVTVFLTMAWEAARQVSLSSGMQGAVAQIKDCVLEADIPISWLDNDSDLETQFILEESRDGTRLFSVSVPSRKDESSWIRVCKGVLLFPEHRSTGDSNTSGETAVSHDSRFEDKMLSYALGDLDQVEHFRVNPQAASGQLLCQKTSDYLMDPSAFSQLIQVSKLMVLGGCLPGKYRVSSVDFLETVLEPMQEGGTPDFFIEAGSIGHVSGSLDVDVTGGLKDKYINIRGISFERYDDVNIEAAPKTLFYKPSILPDIGSTFFNMKIEAPKLEYVLGLVTHKYPAADIALIGLDDETTATILSSTLRPRPRLRSIAVVGQYQYNGPAARHVTTVARLPADAKFHLIVSGESAQELMAKHLQPFGLLCTPVVSGLVEQFDDVSSNVQVSGSSWALERLKRQQESFEEPFTVFMPSQESFNIDSTAFSARFPSARRVVIPVSETSPENIDRTSNHAIILDCGSESILARRPAAEWLSWLQTLMTSVNTLLWVNLQHDKNPFSNVSGSFIRTLRAEDPTLRAASLVIQDISSEDQIMDIVESVFYDLRSGASDETELIAKEGQVHCLRYLPDDERNASVGAAPPLSILKNPNSCEYRVVSAGWQRVTLAAAAPRIEHFLEPDSVIVDTIASSIDYTDAQEYLHPKPGNSVLGLFSAGTVRTSSCEIFPSGTPVVVWALGAHRSSLEVSTDRLLIQPQNTPPTKAVACLAAIATAYAIIDGAARARAGDTFNVRLSGLLSTAISKVCNSYGAKIVSNSKGADFVVSYDLQDGLTVNHQPVSVHRYLESSHRVPDMTAGFLDLLQESANLSTFDLSSIGSSFLSATSRPLETILLHSNKDAIQPMLIDHAKPPKLFSADGAYILLGGMGGLGQHLSTWMVRQGAKTLVTISRSGLSSADSQRTAQQVEELGGKVEAFPVNVVDKASLNRALNDVRSRHKIRGCINLAMVLQDAPFTKMTAERWDTALRVKVEGSWNLHEATLGDDLDFFIMLSSISSVTGNRSQSNYATGNAFQNALAAYRRAHNLPGLSIALGSMSGIGVLANETALLEYCAQMGHSTVGAPELEKVMESAILSSASPACPSLLGMGLEMFETVDGVIQKTASQSQAFWTDMPEFGTLMSHVATGVQSETRSLKERLQSSTEQEACQILSEAFSECLATLMGYPVDKLDLDSSIAAYGLDSLNAMSCRYWFFQQIGVDVPVFDILGCKSIRALLLRIVAKCFESQSKGGSTEAAIPEPVQNHDLEHRPLSHSQRRLWFLQNFLGDKTAYNLLLVCHIEGKVNVPAFREAWTTLLQRHEVLHSRIVDTKNGLEQLPISLPEFPITEVYADENDFDATVAGITQTARTYEFSFENAELVRGWLLKSPRGWRFFLASHHIAWDRSSVPTIFAETTSAYKSLVAGQSAESALKPVEFQFIDYTLWQEACLATQSYIDPLIKYWSEKLEGKPEAVSLLPLARSDKRPAVKQLETSHVSFSFDATLGQAIKAFCAKHAVTPFMFSACSLSALVHRLTGDEDVILGIADGDRGHSAFDNMIGFAVNMLPIRTKIQPSSSFLTMLDEYREACLGAYEHRAMPFDYLLSRLDIPRRTSHSPIFQITVNYQIHGSFPEVDYGDFKFVGYDHYNARQQMDISLGIEETATGALECEFEFDTALYDEQGMRDLAMMYEAFVRSVIEHDGNAPVSDVGILSKEGEEEISKLLEPELDVQLLAKCDASYFDILFARAVKAHPEKQALVDDSRSLTWSDVDKATHRIAARLLKSGLPKGSPVGLFSEQSADLVLGAWGIVRAGYAYIPLDPDFPDARILNMMEDVDMQYCVVDGKNEGLTRMLGCGLPATNVLELPQILASEEADSNTTLVLPRLQKDDPFCCIFTSGSTGRPKGIFIGHGPLRYHQEGYCRVLGTTDQDRILLASAMVFDASLCAIYAGVLKGATVVVASREARYSPTKMIDLVLQQKISNLLITPTQAAVLLSNPSNRKRLQEWTSLKALALGGEPIGTHLLKELFTLGLGGGKATIINAYGPSETTVSVSLMRLEPQHAERAVVPLSPPQFPARLYILDKKGTRTPVGVPGELWIGGPIVNKGYVRRPEMTEKAFVPDPFVREPGYLLYRTGDLFSLSHDGSLTAHGRISGDRQTKIRGMRIELGEIETELWQIWSDLANEDVPGVANLAVVHHKTHGDGTLAAYFAIGEQNIPDKEQKDLKRLFREALSERLPKHMIPTSFVFVKELPSTVSGKTDYKSIASWPAPKPDTGLTSSGAGDGSEGIILTKLQSDIVAVWESVLWCNIEQEGDSEEQAGLPEKARLQISLNDDFFSLGGHSLLLMKLQDGLEKRFGVSLSLAAMFGSPTVAGIERLLIASSEWKNGDLKDKYEAEDDMMRNGNMSNGCGDTSKQASGQDAEKIDWAKETALPADLVASLSTMTDSDSTLASTSSSPAIIMTGASTMIGSHFLHFVLTHTALTVYCIAEPATSHKEARKRILQALEHNRLSADLEDTESRIIAFPGQLSQPTLGLSEVEIGLLDERATAIYHLDSDVSLLKNFDGVRAGNIGSTLFLMRLAAGWPGASTQPLARRNVKQLNYLSTWGVPHLQIWHGTDLSPTGHVIKEEKELNHMTPSSDPGLAYLKVRWACERLLGHAASLGLPVTIFRPSMCANSERSGRGLKRDDINRRILEGSLQTGCVPDFGSKMGGGMSWMSVDKLVHDMATLSGLFTVDSPKSTRSLQRSAPAIYHVVADTHIPYNQLAEVLGTGYDGQKLRTVEPTEWFDAMKKSGNIDMTMQAEVLASWWAAGWVGFKIDDAYTRERLRALETATNGSTADSEGGVNGHTNGHTNGYVNGETNGYVKGHTNGYVNGRTNEKVNGHVNGKVNGHANGYTDGGKPVDRDWILRCVIGEKGF
jgi:amino acid adenylation domain-containing protein